MTGRWLWVLGALVLAGVGVLVGLQAFGDDDEPERTRSFSVPPPTGTSPRLTLPPPEFTTPGGPEPPDPGSLVVGGSSIYPSIESDLSSFRNQQVQGYQVTVISVPQKGVFWVGRSQEQRLLVILDSNGEQLPELRPGQEVDFVGVLVPHDDNLPVEVDEPLLERQRHHALVSVNDLKLR